MRQSDVNFLLQFLVHCIVIHDEIIFIFSRYLSALFKMAPIVDLP